jgi:hypothetical protein
MNTNTANKRLVLFDGELKAVSANIDVSGHEIYSFLNFSIKNMTLYRFWGQLFFVLEDVTSKLVPIIE